MKRMLSNQKLVIICTICFIIISLSATIPLIDSPLFTPFVADKLLVFPENNSNLSLCWVEYDNQRKPTHAEALYYSDYMKDDGVLYLKRGENGSVMPLCTMRDAQGKPVPLKDCVVAVSPMHGSVFASEFDRFPGCGLYVHEDGETTYLNEADPIQAWLYNTGIIFGRNDDGQEYCLFAEYSHARKPTRRVFKGVYPYSEAENWRVVLELDAAEEHPGHILHCHQISRDPYTNFLYLTTGDTAEESRFYCSKDCGETWEIVAEKMPLGHLRCVNIIALKEAFYWASDERQHHVLMSANRREDGVLDPASIHVVCVLPDNQATNSLGYDAFSHRLFFYDRSYPNLSKWNRILNKVHVPTLNIYAYSLITGKTEHLANLHYNNIVIPLPADNIFFSWGNRGRCYVHYTTKGEFAIGFCKHYLPCLMEPYPVERKSLYNRNSTMGYRLLPNKQ